MYLPYCKDKTVRSGKLNTGKEPQSGQYSTDKIWWSVLRLRETLKPKSFYRGAFFWNVLFLKVGVPRHGKKAKKDKV
jgi:hypothetical protein